MASGTLKVSWLSAQDRALIDADVAGMVDYTDVATYTSAAAVAALSVLAGTRVECKGYRMPVAFDRSGTGALAVTVGDGGSATALMASSVLAVDGTEVYYHVGGSAKVYLADDTVDLFFTDAGGMTYTNGKIIFYFKVSDMNKWANVV